MKKIFLLLSFTFCLFFAGCSEDDSSPAEPVSKVEAEKVYNEVVKPQEDNYNLLMNLFTQMDTVSAMDSVLKVFLEDPLIDWGVAGEQGIAIQYKSGIRGGLFIDTKDGTKGKAFQPHHFGTIGEEVSEAQKVIPGSKKTIILTTCYSGSFIYWIDQIIENCNDRFPFAGYQQPLIYKNEEVNFEKFKNLDNYGIIRFDSHGWAWPNKHNIEEVYIMTGEPWSVVTFYNYEPDIKSGEIPIIKSIGNMTVFGLSPEFISKYNDFTSDTTLIYGGFCYSYLGSWPETMVHSAGAGGYFGYDWEVLASYDTQWCNGLFMDLTDMSKVPPLTTGDWMNNDVQKWYWNYKNNRAVYIKYLGYPDLALIESKIEIDLSQVNEVSCDVYPTIDWSCGDSRPNLTVHNIRQPVSISGYDFEIEWNEMRTFTGSVDVQDIGKLTLKFDSTFTKIESFYATNTYHYQADSAKLAQYGYPNTKVQTYSGHDLPIWVNEPTQSRYIYGVSGSDAADYLDKLECAYSFPDGSECSIYTYEFTDEVLQMIRFDFHIK